MMISKCFVYGCTNKPYAKCDCNENCTVFCQAHALQHFESPIGAKFHQCLRLYYTPILETRALFKEKISELRQSLKQYRKDIIMDTKEIIEVVKKNAESVLERLYELEERLSKLNSMTELDEILDLSSDKDPENVLKMKYVDAELELSKWKFPKFISISELIFSSINNYFDIDLNPFQSPKSDSNAIADDYIFFKSTGGTELSQINLATFKETKFTLNLAEDIHFQVSSCILPNKSVFYCANPLKPRDTAIFKIGAYFVPEKPSRYAFIIDKDKNVQRLADSKYSPYMYPIYFDGFVYALGGQNNIAEKYCLETNTWQSCTRLPAGLKFEQTGAVLFETEILLTGCYLTKLIKYSTKDDNYSDIIGLNLNQGLFKTLFSGNKKIYILQHSGIIFESGENDISVWNSIGTNDIAPGYNPTTYVAQNNGCIYMILLKNQLWEFNLSTKQLRLVNIYS